MPIPNTTVNVISRSWAHLSSLLNGSAGSRGIFLEALFIASWRHCPLGQHRLNLTRISAPVGVDFDGNSSHGTNTLYSSLFPNLLNSSIHIYYWYVVKFSSHISRCTRWCWPVFPFRSWRNGSRQDFSCLKLLRTVMAKTHLLLDLLGHSPVISASSNYSA